MRIADGIHRLGPGIVNVYLLDDGGEVTIIDAGMPGDWSALVPELAAMGRTIGDVRALVLTHGHSDHIGFAEKARRERGWTPQVHELDAALARGEVKNPARGGGPVKPLALLSFLLLGLRRGGLRQMPIGAVSTYGDGATLDVPGAPRVILLPGHTPGSAALHVAARDTLFIGDALATYAVTNGSVGPMIAPFSADPALAVESLARLDDVEAGLVLPGHGQPWTGGVGEAVRRIRAGGPDGMGRPHA
jgi:glyoxylase-like metal-dependent hydrolase (beta-lactamase superfamily II)